mgnify:CR=1 FL=1
MIIKGKIFLITGASGGIGKNLSLRFAEQGAKIIAIDKNKDKLKELASSNHNIDIFDFNLENTKKISFLFDRIFKKFNTIDVLINSAGIMYSSPIVSFKNGDLTLHGIDEWNKLLNINLTATFCITANVVKNMISNRTKGLIINLSSISARGNIGQSAYSASKAGVEALSKTWSKELGPLGIRSISIAPGFIDSPGMHKAIDENHIKDWSKRTPLRRLGQIEEVSSAIQMVIENDYFNGSVINIDGGLVL